MTALFSDRKPYVFLFFLLLTIEIGIALFVRDAFVRPFLGDTLATVLVYVGIRAVGGFKLGAALLFSLLISYAVELLQYIHFLEWAGWQGNRFLRTVLGSSFSWGDVLAYAIGAALVFLVEKNIQK